jgi:nitrite reductase/ring-hydroxylating ferredoxin subunit
MEKPDRRKFLDMSWKILAAGLVVEVGIASADMLKARPSRGFGGVVDAGDVATFEEGTVTYFLNGRFYIARFDGSLMALYQKCPHLGCRVPFCDSSQMFECPCHGSIYNIKGEYIDGPAPRGMDRFPLEVRDGRVFVDTGTVVEGPGKGVLTGPAEPAGPGCEGTIQLPSQAPPAGHTHAHETPTPAPADDGHDHEHTGTPEPSP